MKTTISLLVLFVLILGGGYALYTHNQSNSDSYAAPATNSSAATAASTSSPATTPGAASASAGSSASAPGTYTSAQVATHNTSKSCWTSINGNVYDLTKWISQHPGGEAAILSICGKDGSSAFNQQHGRPGDTRPQQMLATFKIGTLAS